MRSTAQVRRGWVAVAASLLTILSVTSTPASAQVARSVYRPLEILRAQARFISGYQTLAEVGVAPATLATSAAGAAHPVLLRVLDLKARLSRFAAQRVDAVLPALRPIPVS